MKTYDTGSVADWLIGGARSASLPQDVLAELCDQLVACGIPLWRVAVFVRTLHPHVTGRRFVWRPGASVEVGELAYERLDTSEFLDSPVVHVYKTSAPLRRRLADPDQVADFDVLRDLRAEGATDYLASPLAFTDGSVHVATWATRNPGGFSDEHIAALEAIVAPFARVAETYALKRTARTLLDTYVGRHTGERILSGQIRRGHTESMRAAIWLSDLRGFTPLADRLAPQTLISLLNRYFDCQVPPIVDRGGEVLKFIGDGLLAIFPLDAAADIKDVCNDALSAADETRRRMTELASATVADGVADLRFGVALHLGEVSYGNIGGGNRLDFTCIGPAVNLAARLEKLSAKLGRTVIISSAFAPHCAAPLAELGKFDVSGFAAQQTVYGLENETPSGPA